MQLFRALRHVTCCSISIITLSSVLINGCGGGGSTEANTPSANVGWIQVASRSTTSTTANMDGTAWVSNSYYASHCAGLACFIDSSRTNDYPGVDVSYINLTTGATGHAGSYYGPGTDWIHRWSVAVPVVAGSNTIQISAYDPSGKGSSVTVAVVPPTPLSVLSTTPSAGATGVLANSAIAVQFSSEIDPGAYFFQVNGPNGAVSGTRGVAGSTVTFTPGSYLANNTTYTVTLPTSLTAISGSSLTSDYIWSFTTMPFPVFGVLSTSPSAGDTNVPRNLTVSATFNGEIDLMSVGPAKFMVSSPSGGRWGYYYSVSGSTVSVTDSQLLQANTTYTATLSSLIRDKSGNKLPFDYVWTFKSGN